MLGREAGYRGFNAAPVLSNALFGSNLLRRYYQPLAFYYHGIDATYSDRLARLRHAMEMQLSLALREQDYWNDHSLSRFPDILRSALWKLRKMARNDEKRWGPTFEIERCLTGMTDSIRESLRKLRESENEHDREHYDMLFLKEGDSEPRASLLNCAADSIVESLFAISNEFSHHDDAFWGFSLDILSHLVPDYGNQPDGVDPFQQRVILKLIVKVRDNMMGNYPAVSRVLLSTLAPLEDIGDVNRQSAYILLKQSLYRELRKLPELLQRDEKRALDKLPENVRFEPVTGMLFRVYRSGDERGTNLKKLSIPEISLFDNKYWTKSSMAGEI